MALTIDSILKLPRPKKVLLLAVILCALAALYLWRFFLPGQVINLVPVASNIV